MTRPTAAPPDKLRLRSAAIDLATVAGQDPDLRHLRFVVRAGNVVVESCEPPDVERHARMVPVQRGQWLLEVASHTGRWSPSGLSGTPSELLTLLKDQFPWVIMPRDIPL